MTDEESCEEKFWERVHIDQETVTLFGPAGVKVVIPRASWVAALDGSVVTLTVRAMGSPSHPPAGQMHPTGELDLGSR